MAIAWNLDFRWRFGRIAVEVGRGSCVVRICRLEADGLTASRHGFVVVVGLGDGLFGAGADGVTEIVVGLGVGGSSLMALRHSAMARLKSPLSSIATASLSLMALQRLL